MEKYNLEQTGQEVQNILNEATTQSELTAETERAQLAEQQLQNDIDAIEEKIPSGASSSNKLATEKYVDDSVSTATATFRGTFNLVSDLGLTVDVTEQQIAAALASEISTADNNDYCFVQIPTSDETATEIEEIDRYKFNGTAWSFEYELNNSGFTADQWNAINSHITSGDVAKLLALPTNAELTILLNGKQNVLTFDNVPTENSNNPVKSGGVYSAIDDEKGARINSDTALQQAIDGINGKIPSDASSENKLATASDVDDEATARSNADQSLQDAIEAILLLIPTAASSLNQLADKAFVNSSIATNTATFRGTFNLVNDLHLTLAATHAQVGNALALAILNSDNNDYCFVQIPTVETAPNEIAQTDRYKFNGSTWEYEYTLNNSGFTSAQWIAINSGITSVLVSKLSELPTNSELTSEFGALTTAINNINLKIPAAAAQNNKLVDTAALEAYIIQVLNVLTVTYNVTSSDGHITFHIAQTDGKITAVTLTTNDIASANDLTVLAGRVTTAENDIDSLEFRVGTNEADIALLQAAYGALTQSDIIIGALPASGVANKIYRVPGTNSYSDYMWNGTQFVLMATYNNAIDPRPKKGSTNLVESGGVFDNMGALDISELNATENPHTLATYADLSAALAAIPSDDYKKGGMSVKFVQTDDNKYVQYRLMADSFSTTEADWQGVDSEPTAESDNLVKSGGVSYLDQATRKGCIAKGAYYGGNHAVGETFQESAIQTTSAWALYSMQCQKGDIISFSAYGSYLLVVDADNTILVSIYNPNGTNKPHWAVIPEGGVHVYLCGLTSTNHYLYLYPKMSVKYKDYEYNMFLDVTYQGKSIDGFARFSYNVPFNFYESIEYNNGFQTKIICVEHCNRVMISGYGHAAYSASMVNNILAYVFLSENLLPIGGADRGLSVYENVFVDVPNNAKYCVVTTQLSAQPNCVLCGVTDKDSEILKNVVTTQEQTFTDIQKETILNNLGINPNIEGVYDIVNKGYFCNAIYKNIGDTVTPDLIVADNWCSDIIDVKEGDVVYLSGYQTTYIVLDSENTIIAKESYVAQTCRIIIPTNGVKFVYVTMKAQVQYVFLVPKNLFTATCNIINNTINREPYNTIHVKKDGTGDYTTIQAAIDAVKGKASINNQYQIKIYDDWQFHTQDLHNVNTGECAVDTESYVHLYGMNGVRTLEIVDPNNSYQVIWWIGSSNLENLHFKITNSRYAMHQSGHYYTSNPEYITRKAVNCVFEHVGGAVTGTSVGTDIQNGEDTTFESCTFIGDARGWFGHSSLKSYDAHIKFNNCKFIVPFGESASISALDSICKTTLTLNNCKLDNTSFVWNMGAYQYGNNNGLPVGSVMPNVNVFGCGDYLFKAQQESYLRLQAPQNVSITSVSGTAYEDVFGGIQFERIGRNNLAGVLIGDNCILYEATGVTNHAYLYSLGCRLGDCSGTNKTLIVTLSNGDSATVTFDKVYTSDTTGVSAPTYTNEQIIAEMNTALTSIGVSASDGFGSEYDFYPNTDIKEYVAAEDTIIPQKKFVHIKENGLAELANGNKVDGFALADIPVKPIHGTIDKSAICTSKQLLLGQVFSPACSNTADGTKFTITNGELVEVSAGSTDYVAIVYNNILKLK